jgi:hypothetical protein
MSPQGWAPGTDEQGRRRPDYRIIGMRGPFAPFVDLTREAAARAMGDANPRDWAQMAHDLVGEVTPVQADSAVGALGSFTPLLLDTALQLATNRDFFRDRFIATQSADERASRPSQAIAGALQQLPPETPLGVGHLSETHPSQVEFVAKDLGGGIASLLLSAGDLAARIRGGEPLTGPTPHPSELPVVGGLVSPFLRSRGGQVDSDLRDLRDQTADQFTRSLVDAQRNAPEWQQMNAQEQTLETQGLQRLANQLATEFVYGVDTKPDDLIARVRADPAFGRLPREAQTQYLAELRQAIVQDRLRNQSQRQSDIRRDVGQITGELRNRR